MIESLHSRALAEASAMRYRAMPEQSAIRHISAVAEPLVI